MDNYFINLNYDDTVFRLKDGELELYVGNGEWERKYGLYADYKTGAYSGLVSADGGQIKAAMITRDKSTTKEEK